MRTIAHISDLHFGRHDPVVAEGLLRDLDKLGPSLAVVSGDFTQRARRSQFVAARSFLDRIEYPKLLIPGNHDIPLFDVLRRWLSPRARYRRYICKDLAPWFADERLAVLGLDTTRPSLWKDGRVSREQIEVMRERFGAAGGGVFKVLATHHPFIPPPNVAREALVGRARQALRTLAECGVELLLAGHLHLGYTGDARAYWTGVHRALLVAQAGTAISTRRRGEPNNYNFLRIDQNELALDLRAWDGERFMPMRTTRYVCVSGDWEAIS